MGVDPLPPSQRVWVVLVTMLGISMSMIDQTIANTALPTIARDVQASAAASIWVINAYQIAVVVTVIPLSSLGDIIGYGRVFRAGLLVFTIASTACALSHTLEALAVARAVQGFGAAAMTITAQPLNRVAFPPSMLGRATGYNAMAVALGAAAGPLVSGAILAVAPWQWLFFVNVPFGIVTLTIASLCLRKESGDGAHFDWISALTSAIALGSAILSFDGLAHKVPLPACAGEFLVAVVVGTFFVRRQLGRTDPMFDLRLFRQLRLRLATFACFASFAAQTIAYVALPFAFQTVSGRTPREIGFLFLPWLLAAALIAPVSGSLADRVDSARLAALGLTIFAAGLLLLMIVPAGATNADVVWRMLVCGIGYGLFQSPNNRDIQGSAPREHSGSTQAIQATARLTGQTVGASTVALVFGLAAESSHSASGISGESVPIALGIAGGLAALSALSSLVRSQEDRRALGRGFAKGALR